MKKQFISIILVFLLLLNVLPAFAKQSNKDQFTQSTHCVISDDWPMFRHDAAHSGYSQSKAPSMNTVFWNISVGEPDEASPVSSYGNVYVSSYDGKVYCIDAKNGHVLWTSHQVGDPLESDPGIADQKMYISSSKLYCFNAITGSELWNTTVGAYGRPPTITDGKVYIGSGVLSCINANNGTFLWSFSSPHGSFFTSPTISDDKIYVGESDENKLFCLSASNGAQLWNLSFGASISATPAVVNKRVYIGTWGGEILCLNGSTGGHIWANYVGNQIRSSIAVANDKIYFGCYNHYLYCYDANIGSMLWHVPTGGFIYSSPVVADGKVYVSSDKFYCFNAQNGSELWNYSTGGGVSSPAISNGKVFVTSNSGKIFSFKDPNYSPDTPTTPKGPVAAGAGIPVNFSTLTTDPDGDSVYYMWDWGEGNLSGWQGPFDSNQPVTENYTWVDDGRYDVRVKAKDTTGSESNWSEVHTIEIGPQINITSPKSGVIYFRLNVFNNSYFYSVILDGLGVAIVLTTTDLFIVANATQAVHSVTFRIVDQKTGDITTFSDTNSSDGFSHHLDVFRGMFEISVFAYDADNTFIDWSVLPYVLFLRINAESSPFAGHLPLLVKNHRLHH